MKVLLLIFLLMPFVCKSQDQDVLINVVIENTANYFENKNSDSQVVRFTVDENTGYFQDDAKVQ